MDPLSRLEQIGFRRVGCWRLVSGAPVVDLDSPGSVRNALYAFVSGREVLYLGKTVKSLRQRLYGYQKPGPTQRTNIACHGKITEYLVAQRSIEVFAFWGEGTVRIGSFAVNVAAGLEDAIIRELLPVWNTAGK
jgi:hypothetical protein